MYENDKLDKASAIEAEIVRCVNESIGDGDVHLAEKLTRRAKEYEKELEAA